MAYFSVIFFWIMFQSFANSEIEIFEQRVEDVFPARDELVSRIADSTVKEEIEEIRIHEVHVARPRPNDMQKGIPAFQEDYYDTLNTEKKKYVIKKEHIEPRDEALLSKSHSIEPRNNILNHRDAYRKSFQKNFQETSNYSQKLKKKVKGIPLNKTRKPTSYDASKEIPTSSLLRTLMQERETEDKPRYFEHVDFLVDGPSSLSTSLAPQQKSPPVRKTTRNLFRERKEKMRGPLYVGIPTKRQYSPSLDFASIVTPSAIGITKRTPVEGLVMKPEKTTSQSIVKSEAIFVSENGNNRIDDTFIYITQLPNRDISPTIALNENNSSYSYSHLNTEYQRRDATAFPDNVNEDSMSEKFDMYVTQNNRNDTNTNDSMVIHYEKIILFHPMMIGFFFGIDIALMIGVIAVFYYCIVRSWRNTDNLSPQDSFSSIDVYRRESRSKSNFGIDASKTYSSHDGKRTVLSKEQLINDKHLRSCMEDVRIYLEELEHPKQVRSSVSLQKMITKNPDDKCPKSQSQSLETLKEKSLVTGQADIDSMLRGSRWLRTSYTSGEHQADSRISKDDVVIESITNTLGEKQRNAQVSIMSLADRVEQGTIDAEKLSTSRLSSKH